MAHHLVTDDFKKRFAVFISYVAYAPIISIPAFAMINYFFLNFHDFILITTLCAIFAGILPVLLVFSWIEVKRHHGQKIDIDIPERKDRNYPLIIVILSYFIGAAILYSINAPSMTTVLMFSYFSNTLIIFFINLYWKISIHAMGVAGPTTVLIYTFGPIGALFAAIIPIVMWSRVYLKRHTVGQVITGALLGFILTILQIHFLIN
ncbi:PAP2 family protein [Methanobacterium sp.]|uniref:PAP2 family protein n=1 Tax=Methanobacterium sp. TaxID=2164 RepID=UPI003C7815AD